MAMSVNSSSSNTTSTYKTNSISGINSGLDTESIVEAMVSNIQTKIDKNKQNTQVAQWQQSAYRAITTKVEDFYNKYFRYSSSSDSVMNPAYFNQDYCNSSSSAVNVGGSTGLMANTVIAGGSIQLATRSSLTTSHQISAGEMSGTLDTSKLADLAGTTMTFAYNGISKTVTFDASDVNLYDTAEGFTEYLNGRLDEAFGDGKVNATFTASDTEGENGTLSLTVADSSSSFVLTTASNGVVGADGILGIDAGTSNKIVPSQMKLSDISGLTADEDGKYSLLISGKSFQFDTDAKLSDVMSAVNSDKDLGITMSFSSVTNTFSLVSDETGAQSEIRVSGSLADAIFGTSDGTEISNNVGKDFQASMSFDGGLTFNTVTRSSNQFTLDGAAYNFTGVGDGTDINFKTGTDVDALANKVKTFVEDYNSIMKAINEQVTAKKYGESVGSGKEYLPLTDAQKKEMSDTEIQEWNKKAQTGLLANDATLQDVATRLRSAMTSVVDGKGLYQYGIDSKSWQDRGVLAVDEAKLKTAIEQDPEGVSEMFTGDNGISSKLKTALVHAVKGEGTSQGVLVDVAGTDSKSTDTESKISKRIATLKEALDALQTKYDDRKDYWWNKFTNLETYISNMNSQSSFLSSM